MRKITVLLAFIFFSIFMVASQNFRRNWSDGKLSWNDFVIRQSETEISGFRYMIEYKSGKQKSNDTTFVRFETHCFIDQASTWATTESRTDQHLRYQQVVFDLAESYRRVLQNKLDLITTLHSSDDQVFQNVINECKAEIERFKTDSKDGQNMKTIVLWEQIVENRLKKYNSEKLPEFKIKDFGYGIQIGLGHNSLTGNLNNYFKPNINLVLGIDIQYKRNIFMLETSSAQTKLTNDFIVKDNLWLKDMKTSYSFMDIYYGYSVIDKPKFKIAPYLGLGITEFNKIESGKETTQKLTSTSLLVGISAYYKINKIINLIPNSFNLGNDFTENSVLTKLYFTKTDFGNNINGYSINLSVSYNIISKKIQVTDN